MQASIASYLHRVCHRLLIYTRNRPYYLTFKCHDRARKIKGGVFPSPNEIDNEIVTIFLPTLKAGIITRLIGNSAQPLNFLENDIQTKAQKANTR